MTNENSATVTAPNGGGRWERFGLVDKRTAAAPITPEDLQTLVERRGGGVFVGIERHPENGARMARVRCTRGHDLGLHERGQLAAGKSPFLCDECRLAEVREHLTTLGGFRAIGYEMVQHPGRSRQRFIRVLCPNGHDLGLHQAPLLLRLKHGLRCQQCYDAALKTAVEARCGWTLLRVERSGGSTVAHLACPSGHVTSRNNCTGLLREPYQAIRCDECLTDEARRLVEARQGVMLHRSGDGVTVACQAGHQLGTFQIGSIRQGKGAFRCEQCLLAAAVEHAGTLGVVVNGLSHAGNLRAVALSCLNGHELAPIPLGAFMKMQQRPRCDVCIDVDVARHAARQLGLRLTRGPRGWSATCDRGHDAGVWTAARLAAKQERYRCPTCLDAELEQLAEAKGVRIRWPRHGEDVTVECAVAGHLIGTRSIGNLRNARSVRCDTCRRERAAADVERCGGQLEAIIERDGEWRAVVRCPSGHPIQQITLGNLANRRRPFLCPICYEATMRGHVERRGAVFVEVTGNASGEEGRRRVLAACPNGHVLPELQPSQLTRGEGPLRCRECAGVPTRAKWVGGERGASRLAAEMRAHVDAGGDPNPPNLYVTADGYKLGNALVRARLGHMDVPEDQWRQLETLGVRRESGHRWFGERLIAELTANIAAGGDARPGIDLVTASGFGLGAALARARNDERTTLDADQRSRLEALGVVFGEDPSTLRAMRRDARRARARLEHDRLAAIQGLRITRLVDNPGRPGAYHYECSYAACGHPAPNRTPHTLEHNTVRRCKRCPSPPAEPRSVASRPSRALPPDLLKPRRDVAAELVDTMRRAVAAGASANPRNKDRFEGEPYGRWLNEARRGVLTVTDEQWSKLESLGTARHVRGPGRLVDEMAAHVADGGDPNPPQDYSTPDGYPLGETLYRARRGTNHVTDAQWDALEALGVSRQIIRRPSAARGQTHGNAKLNDELVRDIRARHASGERGKQLAQRFGVSPASISNILSRRTWAHVHEGCGTGTEPKAGP